MKKNKSIAYIMGDIFATTVVVCIGVCLSSIVIALTLRFLEWVF